MSKKSRRSAPIGVKNTVPPPPPPKGKGSAPSPKNECGVRWPCPAMEKMKMNSLWFPGLREAESQEWSRDMQKGGDRSLHYGLRKAKSFA